LGGESGSSKELGKSIENAMESLRSYEYVVGDLGRALHRGKGSIELGIRAEVEFTGALSKQRDVPVWGGNTMGNRPGRIPG